jgi:preprotein translocase subunit SecG
MEILIILITLVHVAAAAFLILLVLIQKSQEQGVGTAFGGGIADSVLGGSMTPLVKMTVYCAVALLITSVSLGVLHSKGGGDKRIMPIPSGSDAVTEPSTKPATNAVSTSIPVETAPASTSAAPATVTTSESVPVVTPPQPDEQPKTPPASE